MSDTEREIFDAALSDDPIEQVTETPASEPAAEATEAAAVTDNTDNRDPATGRFTPKGKDAPQEQPAATAQTEQATPAQTQRPTEQDHRVPLRELLDERERRQDLQRQLNHAAAQLRQRTEQPKEAPDPFADPNAFLDHRLNPLKQELGSQVEQVRDGFSKLMAIEKHGEEAVTTAFAELSRQMESGGGQYDYARIMRSQHPYGELVKWHNTFQTQQKIGGDLDGFLAKREEELLNDDGFMAKVAERLRAKASGQPAANGSRPATTVQLPPSLNKVAAAASRTSDDDNDMSDAGLFRQALR